MWRRAALWAGTALVGLSAACGGTQGSSGAKSTLDSGVSSRDAGVDRNIDREAGPARDAHVSRDASTPKDAPPNDADIPDQASEDASDALPNTVIEAGPCGSRTGQRGLTSRSLNVAGLHRTFLIYLPAALDPTVPIPFVFVHHGYTMSGQAMYDITEYAALADAQGIGVAFPDGEGGPNSIAPPWNVGTDVCPSSELGLIPDATGNDFAFLDAMKADVSLDQCLDSSHIFLSGFSMGGYFAHQAACMRPDLRAVGSHSGGTHDLSACTTTHMPIIMFHGDADPVIPDGCEVLDASNTPTGFIPAATAWAARNGCGTTMTTTSVLNGTCNYYEGCPADGQVAWCIFSGMPHCWAGGAPDAGSSSCPDYASSTQLEWAFWKQYAW